VSEAQLLGGAYHRSAGKPVAEGVSDLDEAPGVGLGWGGLGLDLDAGNAT